MGGEEMGADMREGEAMGCEGSVGEGMTGSFSLP